VLRLAGEERCSESAKEEHEMTKPTFTLEEINWATDYVAQEEADRAARKQAEADRAARQAEADRAASAEPAFTLEEINQATDEVAQAEAAASKQAEADRSAGAEEGACGRPGFSSK
jgi:hypothetical protein